MNFFKNAFEKPIDSDSNLIKLAEDEISILSGNLKNKDWVEIWDSLCHTPINSPRIVEKMSPESKESLKKLITEVGEAFLSSKEEMAKESSPDKDLPGDMQEALDKISQAL